MTWRDISTAPRDGTPVDLWVVSDTGPPERVTDAYWVTDRPWSYNEFGPDGSFRSVQTRRDGWFAPNCDYEMDGFCDFPRIWNSHPRQKRWVFREPTHWMPLPDPPSTTTESERIAVMENK